MKSETYRGVQNATKIISPRAVFFLRINGSRAIIKNVRFFFLIIFPSFQSKKFTPFTCYVNYCRQLFHGPFAGIAKIPYPKTLINP